MHGTKFSQHECACIASTHIKDKPLPAPRRPPCASFLSFPPNLTLNRIESLCLSFGLYTNGSRQDVLFYVWLLHGIGLVRFVQIVPGCSSLGSLSLLISRVSRPLWTSRAGSFFVCPVCCTMLSSFAGLYIHETMQHTPPRCDNHKCLWPCQMSF